MLHWTGYALPEALSLATLVRLAMGVLPNQKRDGVAAPPDGVQLWIAPADGQRRAAHAPMLGRAAGELAGCLSLHTPPAQGERGS